MCSLAALPFFLATAPAHAGSWLFHVAANGAAGAVHWSNNGYNTQTASEPAWTPPANATGSITIPQYGTAIGVSSPMGKSTSCNASVNVPVTITVTWIPDSSLPSDPAPPSVKIIATSASGALGTTTTPNGDIKTVGSPNDGLSGDPTNAQGIMSTLQAVPAPHITTETGSSFTLTRTFSASASASAPGSTLSNGVYQAYGCGVNAGIGNYTVSIHAQPYNFRRTNWPNLNPPSSVYSDPGDLQFYYTWDSTGGVKGTETNTIPDLAGIQMHENVIAPSSPSQLDANGKLVFVTDDPPFLWNPPVVTDGTPVDASVGHMTDLHSYGGPNSNVNTSFSKPYKTDSFAFTQTYKFFDPMTMQPGVLENIPGNSGPFTITDAVVADPNSASGYSFTVTKDGSTSPPEPLPL